MCLGMDMASLTNTVRPFPFLAMGDYYHICRAKHITMNKALRTTSEGLKKTKTSRLHHALAVSCIIHTTSTSAVISLRELTTATLLVFIPLLEKYLTPDRPRNDDTSFAI